MQSFRDKNKKQGNARLIVGSIIVCVVLLIVAPFIFPSFGNGMRAVARPFWQLENNIGNNFSSFFAGFRTRRSLETENQNLKNQIALLSGKIIDNTTLENQNAALEEILGRKISSNLILGTILVKPNHTLYDTVVLDIGTKDGIVIGNTVYASGNIPIGAISSATLRTSIVTLYSTSGQKTTARIDGQNIDIDLLGRGGGNFQIEVPRDVALSPGTNVLLPGLAPRVVAVIAKSVTDPRDPTQTFLLTSPVNINQLNWVEVEK